MNRLTNTGKSPLGLPGMALLEPGRHVDVSDEQMESFSKNRVIKAWIKAGMLTPGEVSSEPESDPEAEAAEKERLVLSLADHGIEKTTRTGVDNLRQLLEEAEVAEEANEADAGEKQHVIEELATHGVDASMRTPLAKLQALLEEAES